MRLTNMIGAAMILLVAWASQVHAVTLTFDDIPQGSDLYYYGDTYGIHTGGLPWSVANHVGSAWGPPHSGNNVLIWNEGWGSWDQTPWLFKKDMFPEQAQPLYASSVGGYFSTELGVVLEMIGYHNSMSNPVASVYIGASGASWNNVYAQIDSPGQINMVVFRPVTTDALLHFCADDINVEFVPEPASLLAFGVGLVPLVVRRRRG